MKGLLVKDFLVITRHLKFFLLLILVMAVLGGSSMAPVAILLGAVLPMTAIAYDEQSNWSTLAAMMPYSKNDTVLSKYLLGYFCIAGITVLYLLAQLVLSALGYGNFTESLSMLYFALLSGLLLLAVNTPILFKFGVQKGRFVFILLLAFLTAAGTILHDLDMSVSLNLLGGLLPAIIIIAVNAASVRLSLHIRRA